MYDVRIGAYKTGLKKGKLHDSWFLPLELRKKRAPTYEDFREI